MTVKPMLYCLWLVLAGCAATGEDRPMIRLNPSASPEEAVVMDLYRYAETLRGLNSAERLQSYQHLNTPDPDCLKPQRTLKLALLLSGVEPKLRDYPGARRLLESCRETTQGLLESYISAQLAALGEAEALREQLGELRRQLKSERRREEVLREKLQTAHAEIGSLRRQNQVLEAKIQALAAIEQGLKDREQALPDDGL